MLPFDWLLAEWAGCRLAGGGEVLFEVGSCRECADNGAAVARWPRIHQLSTLIFPTRRHREHRGGEKKFWPI